MIYSMEEIRSRVSAVAERHGLKAVYLFGSYARGTATADSDIDLLIDISGTKKRVFNETANRIQWGPVKGMRNLVAHDYGSVSQDIIWETAITDIPVLKAFCEEQLNTPATV